MKHRILCLILPLCLLLTGCGSWMDGSYHSVTPHSVPHAEQNTDTLSASNNSELYQVLCALVENGTAKAVIHVSEFPQDRLERSLGSCVSNLTNSFPIGAYAVDSVDCDLGVGSGGQPVVSVTINYLHDRSEIRRIQKVDDTEATQLAIEKAMNEYADSVVLLVERYAPMDVQQFADDYGMLHPELVIETPKVTALTYPEAGYSRVLEIKFSYQTSRDTLRQMCSQVTPVFSSAKLYISSEDADYQKYSQLCAFLMERFDYRLETSITPAYSLLRHGVGDSRAFATVYASMCRQVGLECQVISGTRDADPWTWNLVCDGGIYYHVDLLSNPGTFQEMTDAEMENYVWDYSAYPAAGNGISEK